ncbi:unnamed protein product, partial [Iphiclides podalirius]
MADKSEDVRYVATSKQGLNREGEGVSIDWVPRIAILGTGYYVVGAPGLVILIRQFRQRPSLMGPAQRHKAGAI